MSNAFDKASLVMLPHAYEEGKVYSLKPTDRSGDFTFSRGTDTATRVGEDGYIKKEYANLLEQSNTFDTTWTTTNSTVTGGQSGYDGSSDAWLLTKSAASGLIKQNYNTSGVYTYSVYAKAGSSNWVQLHSNGRFAQYFDLQNGVVGTFFGTIITAEIEDVGNGWYRCSVTDNGSNGGELRIYPAEGQDDVSGTSGSIYIQDAQLEQGLVATDVIETTTSAVYTGITDNVPRLDYDGDCPSLLLEPQRTNLASSEYFEIFWSTSSGGTRIYNEIISPEGIQNGTKIYPTTTGSFRGLSKAFGSTLSNTSYALSVFAKAGEFEHLFFYNVGSPDGNNGVWFNLTTGNVGTNQSAWSSAKMEDFGNGWYRCSAIITVGGSSDNLYILLADSNGSVTATTNGTDGLYLYGAQIEEGSYATSYIPTYGTTVTRNADTSATNPLQPNVIKSTDSYSIFFDISNDEGGDTADAGNSQWLKGRNSLGANIWSLRKSNFNGLKQHSLYLNIDSDYVFLHQTINKACFVFTSNEVKIFLDGSLNATYTTTNSPLDFDKIALDYGTSDRTTIIISSLVLFSQALTNEEAIALTTV